MLSPIGPASPRAVRARPQRAAAAEPVDSFHPGAEPEGELALKVARARFQASPNRSASGRELLRELEPAWPVAGWIGQALDQANGDQAEVARERIVMTAFDPATSWADPAALGARLMAELSRPYEEVRYNKDGSPYTSVIHEPCRPAMARLGRIWLEHLRDLPETAVVSRLGLEWAEALEKDFARSVPLQSRTAQRQAQLLQAVLENPRCGTLDEMAVLGSTIENELRPDLTERVARMMVSRLEIFEDSRNAAQAVARMADSIEPLGRVALLGAAFSHPRAQTDLPLCQWALRMMWSDGAVAIGKHALEVAETDPGKASFARFALDTAALLEPYPKSRFYQTAVEQVDKPSVQALRDLGQSDSYLFVIDGESFAKTSKALLDELGKHPETAGLKAFASPILARLRTDEARKELVRLTCAAGQLDDLASREELLDTLLEKLQSLDPRQTDDLSAIAGARADLARAHVAGLGTAAELGHLAGDALRYVQFAPSDRGQELARSVLGRWAEISPDTALPGGDVVPTMESLVGLALEESKAQILKEPDAAAALELARGLLSRADRIRARRRPELAFLEALSQRLGALSPDARKELSQPLLESVRGKPCDELVPDDRVSLAVLECLSRNDPAVRAELTQTIRADLERPSGFLTSPLVRSTLALLRQSAVEHLLGQTGGSAEERGRSVEQVMTLASCGLAWSPRETARRAASAWLDRQQSFGDLAALWPLLDEASRTYLWSELDSQARQRPELRRGWSLLEDLTRRMGAGHVTEAARGAGYIERQDARGVPRHASMSRVLQAFALGSPPDSVATPEASSGIRILDKAVQVGSITLPIRH